ncbi:SDR family oxidoreductase [Extibacter muris]|uniref:SDR family oxidoreductase n=1 Tax=Extibacter muris TaxID=1796622 RepID=A0A4R4FFB9_9FIRM|nr:SDR family oxidoreductase [Extibacter muris]
MYKLEQLFPHYREGFTEHWKREEYDYEYETNHRAVYLGCQRAIKIFLEQGTTANIVNVASAASIRGLKGGATYVMTKHAVLGITRNISASFFERGIRCY